MLIPHLLINEHYDDRYFDVVNAIHEAKQVFFRGNSILEKISSKHVISIGETGFGSGRMLVALMDYLNENEVRDCSVVYNTVELHPITAEKMAEILGCFRPELSVLIDLLTVTYQKENVEIPGWHTMHFLQPFGELTLNLWIGEALEMVSALKDSCDAWFLDGHGPKKNPQIWREELLIAIGEKTKPHGSCATYTVAGIVKRGLRDAGFEIEKVSGCGGKKDALRAVMVRPHDPVVD
jgi:tRNA U34 5-methylaminomethyl-2-thiouridine-forming methyltransferase MnmC